MNDWLTKDPINAVMKIHKGTSIYIDYNSCDKLVSHSLRDTLFLPHSWFFRFYGDPVSWFKDDNHYHYQGSRKYIDVISKANDYYLFRSPQPINGEIKRFFVFKDGFTDLLPF